MTKHAPANRLTRFSRPAGSTVDYVQLERERADRMEARAVKLLAERAQLVDALREAMGDAGVSAERVRKIQDALYTLGEIE